MHHHHTATITVKVVGRRKTAAGFCNHQPETAAMPTIPSSTPAADLRARLKILYAGPECWSVRWDEPDTDDRAQWRTYRDHAGAVLVPLLHKNFPTWQETRRTPRPVTMRATAYGVIRSIPEAAVHDFIRVFLLAFPAAVLTGHRLERFDYLAPTEDDAATPAPARQEPGATHHRMVGSPLGGMHTKLAQGLRWGAPVSEWVWMKTTDALALVGVLRPTRSDLAAAGLALKALTDGQVRSGGARARFYRVPPSGAAVK